MICLPKHHTIPYPLPYHTVLHILLNMLDNIFEKNVNHSMIIFWLFWIFKFNLYFVYFQLIEIDFHQSWSSVCFISFYFSFQTEKCSISKLFLNQRRKCFKNIAVEYWTTILTNNRMSTLPIWCWICCP